VNGWLVNSVWWIEVVVGWHPPYAMINRV
jgi:hypothetical protein